MDDTTKAVRCAGCGKTIPRDSDVVRLSKGRMDQGFQEQSEWGVMHLSCFNRAVAIPRAVLDEVLSLSRKAS